jgi:putative MATE family efflux protein
MVREKSFYKTLLLLALPAAFQSLIALSVNMMDNIMVGGLGEINISGVALANQVTVFLTFFIRGVSGGASVLISQYWGKRDMPRIKSVFGIVFQLSFVFTTVAVLLIQLFPMNVMSIFTDDAAIIKAGASFLSIVSFSYILYSITDTMVAMLRCVEVVKISLIISTTTLVLNGFFNYVFIFGRFGFPQMGIRGSAVSTVIARSVELIIILTYVLKIDKRIGLKIRNLFHVEKRLYQDFVRFGVPIVLGDMQWGLVGVFKSTIIGRLGPIMVAANSMTEVVLSLGAVFTTGLSNAACVIIGKTVGSGDYQKTREYSNTIQIIFVGVGVVMMSLVFLIRPLVLSLYDVSAATHNLAMQLLAIGAVTMLGTTYHAACFTGINRGAGDGKFVMKVDMVCGWLIMLPLSAVAAFVLHWPLPIIFLCTRIDQCFKWLIALIRLRGTRWIRNVTRQ